MPNTPLSASGKPPRVPPRWFVTRAWKVHRALYRFMPRRAEGTEHEWLWDLVILSPRA